MKNILVTGAGSLLGQGILRLLQISKFEKKIFTSDPEIKSSGHFLGDRILTLPKATDKTYINCLEKIVIEHKIDMILVGTDVELIKLSQVKEQFLRKYACYIVVSPKNVIDIADDKFLTSEFLRKNGFPYPKSVLANDRESLLQFGSEMKYPLFSKPVDGARSRGLKVINNYEELLSLYSPHSNIVVQEYLDENLGEFTSGCLVINGKCVSTVTLRRDLKDGNTYRAFYDDETAKYDEIIKDIAEALGPEGPVNFQFRVVNDMPVIFEINARFSGTTPLRAFFGFNEVEAYLKHILFKKGIPNYSLSKGMILRAWSDVFVPEQDLKDESREVSLMNLKFYGFKL